MSCEHKGRCIHVGVNINTSNWISQKCSLDNRKCSCDTCLNKLTTKETVIRFFIYCKQIDPKIIAWFTPILQAHSCGFMSYLSEMVQCEILVPVCVHSFWISLHMCLGMFSLVLDQNKLLDRNSNVNTLYILKQLFLPVYNFPGYSGKSSGFYLVYVSLNREKVSKFKSIDQICGQCFSTPERIGEI